MDDIEKVKVLIVNEDGQYLSGTSMHWEFTDDRLRARVFDYDEDHVGAILGLIQRSHGTVWIAVKLDPSEACEFCDRCGARIEAPRAFFDGALFLCPGCRPATQRQ